MEKYTQMPMVVEAEQFWPENRPWPEHVQWINGHYILSARDRQYQIQPGDYVIKLSDAPGNVRPEKPENFRKMFQKVAD